ARFSGYFGASQHSRDFLSPLGPPEARDARNDAFARAYVVLGDAIMALRPCGDLGSMGHGQYLRPLGQTRQTLSHRVGDRASDPGVDFVEDKGGRRAALSQADLDRQE